MKHLKNLLWFFVGISIAAAVMIPSAYAQTAHVDPAFNRIMNGIVSNTPGVTTTSIPSGVSTTGTGTSTVTTASGLRIPIPESSSANVSKAAIAAAASKLAKKAIPIAGAAYTAYEIYKAYKESGLQICAPPDFFCRPSSDFPLVTDTSGLYYLRNGGTGPASQAAAQNCAYATGYGVAFIQKATEGSLLIGCYKADGTVTSKYNGTSNDINANLESGTITTVPAPLVPQTEAQLEQALLDKMNADPEFSKKYYDAVRADYKRLGIIDGSYPLPLDTPLNFPPDTAIILPPDTPLSTNIPNVYTPEKTVKTRTIPLSDGSINTETTKESTKVEPTKTGTTVGDTKISYPTTTTQTVTTTNNTTNITNTTTTETKESPQAEPPKDPVDPCKLNPNRAGCALLGEPPPAEEIPKQDVPISVTPVPFASAAGCPSSESFQAYGAKSITYQPMCDTMTKFRPLFLALASLTAAIVFMGGLKL